MATHHRLFDPDYADCGCDDSAAAPEPLICDGCLCPVAASEAVRYADSTAVHCPDCDARYTAEERAAAKLASTLPAPTAGGEVAS